MAEEPPLEKYVIALLVLATLIGIAFWIWLSYTIYNFFTTPYIFEVIPEIREETQDPFPSVVLTAVVAEEEGTPIWQSGLYLEGLKSPQGENSLIIFLNYPQLSSSSGGLLEILMCESGGQHYNLDGTIKRGKAGEYGIAQFKWNTFYWMSEQANFNGSIYSAEDQVELLVWALENNLGFHWSCARNL